MEINPSAQEYIDIIKERCKKIKPLVAVRTIAYNHEPYIRECLDGLVMQKTDFPFIAIVHDDVSTDKTAEIIREYAEKYPDIIFPIFEKENQYSKRDGSLRKIMKLACETSGAKYYAVCEGDDYWTDPYKLQKQFNFMESNPEYGLCYTYTRYFYQDKEEFDIIPFGRSYDEKNTVKDLIKSPYQIPTATIFYRSDIYKEIEENHLQLNNWLMGDFPLSLGFASVSKIHLIPIETAVYRVLSNSASHFTSLEKELSFRKSVFEVKRYFAKINNLDEKELDLSQDYARWCFSIGLKYNDVRTIKDNIKLINSKNPSMRLWKFASNSELFTKILMNIYKRIKI